jgi:putative transposase
MARVVIPGHPHQVTQRGNRRARTFFGDADDAFYRDLLAENCRAAGVEVWAWCLMPNHVHLVLMPPIPTGCAGRWRVCIAPVPASSRRAANAAGISGKAGSGAVAMDEEHLAAALRYASLSPAWARLVERAQDWRWSSTRAHLRDKDDGLTALAPIKHRFPQFGDLLASEPEADLFDRLAPRRASAGRSEMIAFSPASSG